MQQLERLRDEFDFSNPTATAFDIAIDFTSLDHFVLDTFLDRGDLPEQPLIEGARITKGIDRFQKFVCEFVVAGYPTRFDQHHAFPSLSPLRIKVFVAGERTRERTGIAF